MRDMATSNRILIILAFLGTYTIAYYDAGDATIPTTTAYVPTITQHHLLPRDYEIWTKPRPSMITAVAPSLAMLGDGYALEYSIHFNNQAPPRYQQQQGLLKRGVFASDPPLSTCQQCGPDGRPIQTPKTNINGTGFTSTPCSTIPYTGIFRSPAATSSFCFETTYSGVFSPSTTATFALPCCRSTSIPSACLLNATISTPVAFGSGLFTTSTTFVSDLTTSTFTSISSMPSSLSSSTSRSSSSSPRSSSTSSSSSASGSITPTPGSTSSSSASRFMSTSSSWYSSSSSSPSSSSSSLLSILSSVSSVIVISSTTITVSASSSSSGTGESTLNTITVITATPSSANPTFDLGPNSITGCGTASGCGTANGSGTVYLGPGGLIPVVSSGTAIGCASTVIGCGTLIGTGSFVGTAIITGCGEGTGYATITGEGTVWPAALGGLVSFVSSGTLTGSGRVKGCGTITGTGTFFATVAFTRTLSPTPTNTRTTIEVYVSYCPTTIPGGGLPRMGGNITSPHWIDQIGTTLGSFTITNSKEDDIVPACRECPNSAGICCPRNAECDERGKCPWSAMETMGYIRFGYLLVNWRNTSDGGYVIGDKKPLREGDEEAMSRVKDKAMAGGDEVGDGDGDGAGKRAIERWDRVEDRDTGSVLAKRDREVKIRQGPAKKVEKRGWGNGMIVKEDAIVA